MKFGILWDSTLQPSWSLCGKKKCLVSLSKFLCWNLIDWREDGTASENRRLGFFELHIEFRTPHAAICKEIKRFICFNWCFFFPPSKYCLPHHCYHSGSKHFPSLAGNTSLSWPESSLSSLDMLENSQAYVTACLPLLKLMACGSKLTLGTSPGLRLPK